MRLLFHFILALLPPLLVGFWLPVPVDNGPESLSYSTFEAHTAYPDSLPGTFTGGFGEETCRSCHFDYELNNPAGSLTVISPDETYEPGVSYEMRVVLESDRLAKAGFQLTARFEDGSQAGGFRWKGDRLRFTHTDDTTDVDSRSIRYLQHSAAGTAPTSDTRSEWRFEWIAPKEPKGTVVFNIAANAGNDDLSAFGDWIYQKEFELAPE